MNGPTCVKEKTVWIGQESRYKILFGINQSQMIQSNKMRRQNAYGVEKDKLLRLKTVKGNSCGFK